MDVPLLGRIKGLRIDEKEIIIRLYELYSYSFFLQRWEMSHRSIRHATDAQRITRLLSSHQNTYRRSKNTSTSLFHFEY